MNDCTCSNCIFIDNDIRYCYDCQQYTKMPPREEIERRIALQKAKDELNG